jgi:hypothetical protein
MADYRPGVRRRRARLPLLLGAGAVFALLAVIGWRSRVPHVPWAVACLGLSLLISVLHGLALERAHRRWNETTVDGYRRGVYEPTAPPRGSLPVLTVALAFALLGGAILILGLLRYLIR